MPASRPVTKTTKSSTKAARKAYAEVPRKSVAHDPGKYSKTPHEYGDLLIRPDAKGRTRLGGALQRDLVYWIERETWGKNAGTPTRVERPEYAKLSLTMFARLCGSDRRTVARSLADLAERGIIEARDRKGCGPTVAKMYKLTPENWKTARYYEPKAADEAEEAEAEEEAPEEAEPAQAAASDQSTVAPGKSSRPQSVAVTPKDGKPITISVVYEVKESPFPLSFTSRPGRNGKLHISCRATALHRFAFPSPSVSHATVEDKRFIEFRDYLNEFVLNFWGELPDENLISAVVSTSGKAPLSVYRRFIAKKFRNARSAAHHTTGLLIELAKDARRTHEAEQAQETRRTTQLSAPAIPLTPEEQAAADIHNGGIPEPRPRTRCGRCKGTGKGKEKWINRGGVYGPVAPPCQPCNGTGWEGGL